VSTSNRAQTGPLNPVIKPDDRLSIDVFAAPKHPGSICVGNYKGGVGKTTISCLLGYYLAGFLRTNRNNPRGEVPVAFVPVGFESKYDKIGNFEFAQ
jgi:hypothetical protein